MDTINWGKLVLQNRAKAIGIPWSKEDLEAMKNGLTPDEVRAGYTTKEEVTKSADKPVRLSQMRKDTLCEIAKGLGIEFDKDIVTRGDLILEIEKRQQKTESDNKSQPTNA